MSQGITPEFLEELKYRTDLVALVSQYVPLQMKGGRYKACCPFHHEKTPSFYVDPAKGFYHCFGCQASGDAIKFIQEIESMDFMSAVRYLADKAGMEMPEVKFDPHFAEKKDHLAVLKEIMHEAARYYNSNLTHPEKGEQARKYLENRGIDSETITRYGLGLSMNADGLPGYLGRKGYKFADMKECGLIANDRHPADAFAERIIVPIFNALGEVVAFGGRIFPNEKGDAKYKNSTNTPIFDKGKTVYGINFIKKDKRKLGTPITELILVEGYMDVIALGSAGFKNAVACMGTALTEGQAREIRRLAQKVYVCYDDDSAGHEATRKNILTLMQAGLDLKVVRLTGGKDPDETIRQDGVDAFQKFLDNAIGVMDYRLMLCEEGCDLSTRDGRAKYLIAAKEFLLSIEDPAEREIYIKEVGERSKMEGKLRELLAIPRSERPKDEVFLTDSQKKNLHSARFVLNRIINNAPYVDLDLLSEDWFENSVHKRIFAYALTVPPGEFNESKMYTYISDDEVNFIDDIDSLRTVPSADKNDDKMQYKGCVRTIAIDYYSKQIAELKEMSGKESDTGKLLEIAKKISALNTEKFEIIKKIETI